MQGNGGTRTIPQYSQNTPTANPVRSDETYLGLGQDERDCKHPDEQLHAAAGNNRNTPVHAYATSTTAANRVATTSLQAPSLARPTEAVAGHGAEVQSQLQTSLKTLTAPLPLLSPLLIATIWNSQNRTWSRFPGLSVKVTNHWHESSAPVLLYPTVTDSNPST